MTDDEINIAIAEACGWKGNLIDRDMEGNLWPRDIPSFCTDLNAMHEAEEQGLKGNQLILFALLLEEVLRAELFGIRATARQRAEAFLRTLRRWKE